MMVFSCIFNNGEEREVEGKKRGLVAATLWGKLTHLSMSLPLEVSCRVCSSFSASMAAVCCCLMSSLKAVLLM